MPPRRTTRSSPQSRFSKSAANDGTYARTAWCPYASGVRSIAHGVKKRRVRLH